MEKKSQSPVLVVWGVLGMLAVVLGTTAGARADQPADYDSLVGQAYKAASEYRFADCARLYGQAVVTFPAGRPSSELQDVRDNRQRCERYLKSPPPHVHVSLGRLPTSVPALIGRKDELLQLDAAWDSSARRRLVAVVAVGGQGKTTLVVNWLLKNMQPAHFRGARQVFGWSFYRQGTSDEQTVSADEFLAAALTFFGDPDSSRGTPFDKADRLRDLIRKQRSLLVLDGLEPLQERSGAKGGEGKLRDRALASLLADLAVDNPGMVVVTSRMKLSDLATFEGQSLRTIELRPFSEAEGVALLKLLKVTGSEAELAAAVREYKGHPLALELLGNLLRQSSKSDVGEISQRSQVGPLEANEEKGGHAQRVMAAYDRWFGAGPRRSALRLLGLFDRMAPGGALQALRAGPVVPGLNDTLVGLNDAQWNQVILQLRDAGLVEAANASDPDGVDAHPLVREHFGTALHKESEAAWKEGHRRLFRWYAASTKYFPGTAEEMGPLYTAVRHGCRAGKYQAALNQILWRRIWRSGEGYAVKKLGMWGADLSALSGFFDKQWLKPVPALNEWDRAFVMGEAGFNLRALGRLNDALDPMHADWVARCDHKDWKRAAIAAGNLSELHLELGRIKDAISLARQAVSLSDQSNDAFQRMTLRATLANALHQAGALEEAGRLFDEAEAMQRAMEPETPLLYSLRGYNYSDLLLSRDESGKVLQRVEQTIRVTLRYHWLLDVGYDHLALGRAHLARLVAGRLDQEAPARQHLDQAVDNLRAAGYQVDLSRGLIHRAAFYRQIHAFDSAARDLEEAQLLATRSHMRLHEADVHMELARLRLAQKRGKSPLLALKLDQEAHDELAKAQTIITETGYVRQTREAADLAQQLDAK